MIIDDRLATVLRTPLAGAPGTRTQVRQLIDLLDRLPDSQWSADHDDALAQLGVRLKSLPQDEQAQIAAEAGLRSPRLAAHFAETGPRVAAAALGAARLTDAQWLALIPALSPMARGLLRHRRDMGRDRTSAPARLLARLGVGDSPLPLPAGYEAAVVPPVLRVVGQDAVAPAEHISAPSAAPVPAPALPPRVAEEVQGISAIVRRIEAFRRNRAATAAQIEADRDSAGAHPHLPFADGFAPPALTAIDITLDPAGEVVGADGGAAAMLIGHRPFTADRRAAAYCDPSTLLATRQRRPVREGRVSLEGAPAIAGDWQIDAVPCFDPATRTFTGWRARLRRPRPVAEPSTLALRLKPGPANDDGHDELLLTEVSHRPYQPHDTDDRLRQLLHELKTPINAIQGFAELIQQEILGSVAHQYRGYAASIVADAATMLAQFEAIDQLVRLESGRQPIDPGETDARHALTTLVDRLAPLFDQRQANLAFQPGDEPLPLGIAPDAFEAMIWRLLSTIAAAAIPGERLSLRLGREGDTMRLAAKLPDALVTAEAGQFVDKAEGVSLLGRGFSLRLLGAEARAAGGSVRRSARFLTLTLPLLTHSVTNSSHREASAVRSGD
ncbi:histidine kinase dimerization/phospho-acceptor domain-containing protein [Novosphingobium sp.]|uniref:histidine kinase dimerization/phospho-acceptor domain-containing protein n=1 Tax=Novosphingobium sp. TaxID=1874826 RepID=UPI0025EF37B9|nr:histidine kinase dimerization/phospho-acceptor domain-containing protein [Novosphingobium sp.]